MVRILLVLTVRKSRGHFERVDRCRVGRKGACLLNINTAAEELKLQMMETSERVLGEEHPDTLTSMANLAHT